jgi:MFS family permease
MWTAQFVSNIGGWMQTVGAQWLMLSLTTAAAPVALIQTASSLPVLLFAVPAGAVGDLVDRRRFLLVAQTFMLLAALALGALALAGLVTPVVLLALVFALGAGQAWTSPTWQTLQPELVPAAERPQAIALGSVNMNLVLSTLNSVYQSSLPGWVKARGMGFYLIVFQGGNAIGSAAMGLAAGQAGLSPTLLAAAIGLALGPLLDCASR